MHRFSLGLRELLIPQEKIFFELLEQESKNVLAGALALALAISSIAESTQLFSTKRYPSATDVLMALFGTALGFSGAFAWRNRELP